MAPILALVVAGCAAKRPELQLARSAGDQPLYIGHAETGEVVIASRHYQAMNGLAVAGSDVGAGTDELLLCSREIVTGTHLPHWICRYPKEAELDRLRTQQIFDTLPKTCSHDCMQ